MSVRFLIAGLPLALLGACTLASTPPATAPAVQPTETAERTSVPTRIPTPTPVELTLRVTDKLVNCRYGPSTLYEPVNELDQGSSARVLGRNDTSTWWYIRDPGNPNGYCWVSAGVTGIIGEGDRLPVVQPPHTYVTQLNLIVEPNRVVVDCTQFPQTFFFEAEVAANGPALVNWQWEASTGVTSDVRTLLFDEAGTKVINEYYQVGGPNDYWVKLHILHPNEMTSQVNFRATCGP
ncbi:MAG: SH3 domain-containing protein [Chloroflexi bacterium]|nr:SH3 domain-containing protein [Chloroflexota bacterium]